VRASFGGLSGRRLPAGLWIGPREQELGGLLADLLHLRDDHAEAAAAGDPVLVERGLPGGQAAG